MVKLVTSICEKLLYLSYLNSLLGYPSHSKLRTKATALNNRTKKILAPDFVIKSRDGIKLHLFWSLFGIAFGCLRPPLIKIHFCRGCLVVVLPACGGFNAGVRLFRHKKTKFSPSTDRLRLQVQQDKHTKVWSQILHYCLVKWKKVIFERKRVSMYSPTRLSVRLSLMKIFGRLSFFE